MPLLGELFDLSVYSGEEGGYFVVPMVLVLLAAIHAKPYPYAKYCCPYSFIDQKPLKGLA